MLRIFCMLRRSQFRQAQICRVAIWSPGLNTLNAAVRQGVVPEELLTRSAERLYAARFQLGMFDPSGRYDAILYSENGSDQHRTVALKAAEESLVLLKN